MKLYLTCFFMLLMLGDFLARGQGTFIYDQQSSMFEGALPYGAGGAIQQMTPPNGQSFIPTLSAVDFFRLNLNDNNPVRHYKRRLKLSAPSRSDLHTDHQPAKVWSG